jgi:hypothetical protein
MKIALSSLALISAASLMLSISAATPSRITHSVIHKSAMKADTTIDWDKMSKADHKQYMKDIVLPKMKPLLQTFDPKKFEKVNCVTCHGNGARTGEFKMPNPDLPKLPASREGWDSLNANKAKMMEFMSKTMKPTMADLLGMKPYDPKTGTGFGCGDCHTTAKK